MEKRNVKEGKKRERERKIRSWTSSFGGRGSFPVDRLASIDRNDLPILPLERLFLTKLFSRWKRGANANRDRDRDRNDNGERVCIFGGC